jgi:hypothetical protein
VGPPAWLPRGPAAACRRRPRHAPLGMLSPPRAPPSVPTLCPLCLPPRAPRRKRLEELRRGPQRPRFGALEEIRRSDWVAQVTQAPAGVWVVCHLYKDRWGAGGGAGALACRSGRLARPPGAAAASCLPAARHWAQLRVGQAGTSHPCNLGGPPCSVQDCCILNQCLVEVAREYPATKFVKIVSTGEARLPA